MGALIRSVYSDISRLFFWRVGKIGKNTILRMSGKIKHPEGCFIGADVFIGADFKISIFPRHGQTYQEKEQGELHIGNNVSIQSNLKISCANSIKIEDDCVLAGNVFITDNNHGMDPTSVIPYKNQDITSYPIKIGKGSWIGENAIILPGVILGEKCIVAAGSVVTRRNIPDYSIIAGNPARIIKQYDFEKQKWVRKD